MKQLHFTVPIEISNENKMPIYAQIGEQMKAVIASGSLTEGSPLPGRQFLAKQLGVNINTINHAYRILETEGFIHSKRGTGSFVKERVDYKTRVGSFGEIRNQLEDVKRQALTYGLSVGEFSQILDEFQRSLRSGAESPKGVFIECHEAWAEEISVELERELRIDVRPVVMPDRQANLKEVVDSVRRSDIIITTHAHFSEIKEIMGSKKLIFPLDLHLSHELLTELSNIKESQIAVPFVNPSTVRRLSLLLKAQGFKLNLVPVHYRDTKRLAERIRKYKAVLVPKSHLSMISDIVPDGVTILAIKPALGEESLKHLKEAISKLHLNLQPIAHPPSAGETASG